VFRARQGVVVGGPREIWTTTSKFRVFRYDIRCGRKTWPAYVYIDSGVMASKPKSLTKRVRKIVTTRGHFLVENSLSESIYTWQIPKRIFVFSDGEVTEKLRWPGRIKWLAIRLLIGAAFGFLWSRFLTFLGVDSAVSNAIGLALAIFPVMMFKIVVKAVLTPPNERVIDRMRAKPVMINGRSVGETGRRRLRSRSR
jgi:hypothetical protein